MGREGGDGGGRRPYGVGGVRHRWRKPRTSRPRGKYRPARNFLVDKPGDDLRREELVEQSREFANAALCHLNYKENFDFELVKPGFFGVAGVSRGLIFHINFTAKWRADPDDPLQTFFAQIRFMALGVCPSDQKMFVDCCVNLGPTDQLPEKVYLGGCQYCFSSIYHPIGGCEKLLLGCQNDDDRWLYGDYESDSDSGFGSGSDHLCDKTLEHSGGCTSDPDV